MFEDGIRVDKRISQANDYVRGALGEHERMRIERDLAFDPEFQAKVVALANRLKPAALDRRVLDLLPVAVDQDWRRRTKGLTHLGQRKSRAVRVFWPANDRGRRGRKAFHPAGVTPNGLAQTSFIALAAGLLITTLGMIALNPQILPTLTAFLH